MSEPPEEIELSVWVKRGKMIVFRDALDWDDPDHPYNYLKERGLVPEEYGQSDPRPLRAREAVSRDWNQGAPDE